MRSDASAESACQTALGYSPPRMRRKLASGRVSRGRIMVRELVAEAVAAVVAEGAFLGLVGPGHVPVGRDRDVAYHLAH
jgi:hypothetical protein